MHRTEPTVYLVGETKLCNAGLESYLDSIGMSDWSTDAPSDGEKLIEVMGRLCYMSFKPGLNPNVQKVRQGNDTYLSHVLEVQHGSLLEHVSLNFILADISRVVTHEIVRHRAGTAFSQVSGRFVRLEDLGLWLPQEIEHDPYLKELFETTFRTQEELQLKMAAYLKLDECKDFGYKKKMTSAMRRLAPEGLATTLGFSANVRALRHVIYMRTSRHAEVEIRFVFDKVGHICKERYPNLFGDFQVELIDGIGEWTTPHVKV